MPHPLHFGSSLEEYLEAEGILEEATARAIKAIEAMRAQCEARLRAEADELPESYKRSKKKLLKVADDMISVSVTFKFD